MCSNGDRLILIDSFEDTILDRSILVVFSGLQKIQLCCVIMKVIMDKGEIIQLSNKMQAQSSDNDIRSSLQEQEERADQDSQWWNDNESGTNQQEQFRMKQLQANEYQQSSFKNTEQNIQLQSQLQTILQAEKLISQSHQQHQHSLTSQTQSLNQQEQLNQEHEGYQGQDNRSEKIQAEISLEALIMEQKLINSSILSKEFQLKIIRFFNRFILTNLYSLMFKIISHSCTDETEQIVCKLISYGFFFFIIQFVKDRELCSTPNQIRKRGLKHVINKTRSLVIGIILISLILLILPQSNFNYVFYFIWSIIIIYKTVQLLFDWMIFLMMFDQNDSFYSNTQNYLHSFIRLLIQITLTKTTKNESQQTIDLLSRFSHKIKIEQLIRQILDEHQMNSPSVSVNKENKHTGKNGQKNKENKLKLFSQILLEMFETHYSGKVRQLLPKTDRIPKNSNQSYSHPLITIKNIPKNFSQIENEFYHQLIGQVSSIIFNPHNGLQNYLIDSRRMFNLCRCYIKYQQIIRQSFINELQKFIVLCHIKQKTKQPIPSQLSQLSLTQFHPQIHPLNESKSLSSQQLHFMSQLYEFYKVFLQVVSLKLNLFEGSQSELAEFLSYIEESISVKLFLLNSKRCSINNKSFTVFKQRNQDKLCFGSNIQNGESITPVNSSQSTSIQLLSLIQKPSQYLKIDYNTTDKLTQQQLIVYENFSKNQNTIEKLDQLIQKLVERQNISNENESITNNHEYNYNNPYDDNQSHQYSYRKQSSSSDEQQVFVFNKSFNPFLNSQQNTIKPNIFSKSQFQFNFNVQHQMSQLFSQLKDKRDLDSDRQEIKQYQ